MRRMPWLKCWLEKHLCKKQIERLPFEGKHLFRLPLDAFIQRGTLKKSMLLPQNKKAKVTGQKPVVPSESKKSFFHKKKASGCKQRPMSWFHKKNWTPKPPGSGDKWWGTPTHVSGEGSINLLGCLDSGSHSRLGLQYGVLQTRVSLLSSLTLYAFKDIFGAVFLAALERLLFQGVIATVAEGEWFHDFCSNLFRVPKSSRDI